MYDKRQVQKRTNFKKRRRKQFDVGLKPINFRATPLSKFLRAVSKQTRVLCSCFRKRKSENKINEMEFVDTNLLQQSTETFSRTNKEDLTTILKEITSEFFAQRKQEQTFTSHNPVNKAKSESSILSATKKIIRTTQSDIYRRKLYHSQLEMILDHKSPPRRPNVSPFLTMSFFTLRKEQKYNTYPVHVNFKTDDESDLTETCNKSSQYSETQTFTNRKDILIRHNVKTSTRGLQKYSDISTQFDDITSQLSKYGNIKQKVAQYYEINPTHKTSEFRENEKLKTSLDTNTEMGKGKLIYSHGKLARNSQDNEKVPSTNREALFLFTNERATFESTDDSTPAPSINKIQTERLSDRKKYTCIHETELQATPKYFAEFVDLQHTNDCCTSTSETCICSEMYPKFSEWYEFLQHNMQDQKKIKHDESNKIKNDVITSPLANKNSTYKGNKQKEVMQHHSDDNKIGNNETAITDIFDDIKRQEKEKKSLEELRIENRNIMEILNQRYPTFVGMSIDGNVEDNEIKNEILPKKSKDKKIKTTRAESTKVPKIIIKEKSGKKRRITFQLKKDEIATTQNEETTPVIESLKTEKISEMKDLFQIFLPETTDCNPNNEETHASENPTLTLDSLSNIEKIFKGILIDLPNSKRKISPNARQPSEQEIKRYKEWSLRDTECRKPSMTKFPTNYELKPLPPDLVKKLSPDRLPTKSIVPLLKQNLEKSNMSGQLLNVYNVSKHKETPKEVKVDDISVVEEDNEEPALSSISSTIIAKSSKPTMKNALIQSEKETNKFAQVVLHLKNQKTQSSSSYLRDVFKKESKNKITPKLSQTSSKSSVSSFIKSLLICVRYSESQTSVCDMSFQSDMPDQKDFDPKIKRKTSRKLIFHTTEQKSKYSQSESSSSLKADKGAMKEKAKLKSIGVQAITTKSVKDKNMSSPSFTRITEKKPVYCDAFCQTARIQFEEIAESPRQSNRGPFTEGSYCDFDIISRPSGHRRSKRTTKMNDMDTLSDNKKTFSRVMKSFNCFPRNFLTPFACICQEKASSTLSVVEDADENRDNNLTILMNVRSSLLSTGVSLKPSITPSDEISRHLSSCSTVTRDFARKIVETRNEDTLKIVKSISVSDVSSKEYERIKNVKSSSHEFCIKNDKTQMVVEKSDFMLVNVSSGDSHFVYGNLNSEINSFSRHSSSTIAIKRESRVILQTVVNSSNSLISNRHDTNNDSKIDKLLSFNSLPNWKNIPSTSRQKDVDEYTLSAIQLSNENIGVSSSLLRSVSKKGLKFTNNKSDDKLAFNLNVGRRKEIQPKVAQNLDFASKSSSIIELLPQTSIKSTNQIRTDDKLVFHCIRRRKKLGQTCDNVASVSSSFIELLPQSSNKSNSLSEDDDLSGRYSESKGSLTSTKSRKSKKSKKPKKPKKTKKFGRHQMSSEILLRDASHITIDEEFIERIRFLRLKSGLREHLSEKRNLKLLPVFGTYKSKYKDSIDKKLPPVLDKIEATEPMRIETDIIEVSKPEGSESSLELNVDKEQLNINKSTSKEDNVYKIKNFNNIIDEKPINKYEIFNELPSSEKVSVIESKPDDEIRPIKVPSLEDEQIENVVQLDTLYDPTVEEEVVLPDKIPEEESEPEEEDVKPIQIKKIAKPPKAEKEPKYDDDHFVKFERIDNAPEVDELDHFISFRVHPHDYSRVELNFKDFEIILKPPSDNERNLEDFKVTYLPDKIIITLPWPGQAKTCILDQLGKKTTRKIFLKGICRKINKQCLMPLRNKPKNSTNVCNIGTMTKETLQNMASRIKVICKDTQTKNRQSSSTESTSKSLKKHEGINAKESKGEKKDVVKKCSCITQYSQVFIAIKEPDECLITPDQLTSEDGLGIDNTNDVFPTDSFNKNESQASEELYKTDKNSNDCILPLKEYFDQKSLEDVHFPSEKSSKDVQKENYPQISFELKDTANDSQNKVIEILEDAVESESNVDGSDRKIQVSFPKPDTEQTSDDLNDSQKKIDVEILEDLVESDFDTSDTEQPHTSDNFEITEDDIEMKTEELLENVVENVSSVYVSDHTDGDIQEITSSIFSIEELLKKDKKEGNPDAKQDSNLELPDQSSRICFSDESVSSKTKYCGIEHFILEKLIQMHRDKSQNKRQPPEHKLKVPEKNENDCDDKINIRIKTHNKESQTNLCYCRKDDTDDENNDVTKHYRRKLFNGILKRCFKSQCRLAGGYCPYHLEMDKFNDDNSKKRSEQNFNFYMSIKNGSENYKTKDVENIKIRKYDQAEFDSSSNYSLSYHQVTDDVQNNDEESYILVPISRSKQNVRFVDSKFKKLFPFYENISEELETSSSSNIEHLAKENYSFASNSDVQRLYQSKCYKSKDVSITRRNCEFFEFHSSTISSNTSTRFFTESTIKSSSVSIAKTSSINISESSITSFSTNNETSSKDISKSSVKSFDNSKSSGETSSNSIKKSSLSSKCEINFKSTENKSSKDSLTNRSIKWYCEINPKSTQNSNNNFETVETSPEATTSEDASENTSERRLTMTTSTITPNSDEVRSIIETLYELCPHVLYDYYRRQFQNS